MTATFDNTIGILAKAYLNGTLLKGSCHACAVGNICATAIGTKVVNANRTSFGKGVARWENGQPALWNAVFCTEQFYLEPLYSPGNYRGDVKERIDATGYTWQELARIEWAFEKAHKGYGEEAEFAGLMAVVDVLAAIHEIDLSGAEAAKLLFVKAEA